MKKTFLVGTLLLSALVLTGCTVQNPPDSSETQENEEITLEAKLSPEASELLQFGAFTIPETKTVVQWMGTPTVEWKEGEMRGTATLLSEYTTKMYNGVYASFVAVNSGGSGEKFYLATFVPGEAVIENKSSVFLGDRIQPVSLTAVEQSLAVEFLTHSEDQAMVEAPNTPVSMSFSVRASDGNLVEDKPEL